MKNKETERNRNTETAKTNSEKCNDEKCPLHGHLKIRKRAFKGIVKKTVQRRAVVEFERLVYYKKYERFAKAKTRLHAYIPACLIEKIKPNDCVKIAECRPLSKIVNFVIIKKIK